MLRRLFRALPLVFVTLATVSCDDPPITTIPDPPKTIRPFSGTLTINGGATHRFTTTASGNITVQIKGLAPVDTVVIGLSLGIWTGASCNMQVENPSAALNTTITGSAAATGEFCARVYDLGRLAASTNYTLEVTHF